MVGVLIYVFSDVIAFGGFNTGCRVLLILGICVVLLSLSDSGDYLTSLVLSWSMFPVSYLGHSSRKTHSFYRTGMSPYLYNHNKPRGMLLTIFWGKVLPLTLFQTQSDHFRYPFSDIPPLPARQKKSVPVCDFTFLLPEIHVLVITAFQKVDSLKGTQTNFWRYVFGLANT